MSKSFRFPEDPARRPVLVEGVRTPFTKAGTDFEGRSAADLGVWVVRELLSRSELAPEDVDELIFGCVGQASSEANVARVIALRAGLPEEVPAFSVHRNCASGMQSLEDGARRIAAGEGSVYVVGGTESMSSYPLVMGKALTEFFGRLAGSKTLGQKLKTFASFRPGFLSPRVTLVEGLTDPTCGMIMGLTAEKLANEFGVSRREQDEFALQSHERALGAWETGAYDDEVLTVYDGQKGKAVAKDNGPRDGQSLEALAKLRPYFDRSEGTVTVGNACPITDGAVALLLTSEAEANARDWKPLARLKATAVSGLDPTRMGLGPAFASPAVLDEAGMGLRDVDVWEINEAFSAQVLACTRALESETFCRDELGRSSAFGSIDPDKLNRRGGAVALGHPVGATGARLALGLTRQLRAMGGGVGVATLCIGGGQGAAQLWEAA